MAEIVLRNVSLHCELTSQAINLSTYEERSTYDYTASLQKVCASTVLYMYMFKMHMCFALIHMYMYVEFMYIQYIYSTSTLDTGHILYTLYLAIQY